MTLNTKDRTKESAYHEYFLVSQVKVDEPFVVESLDIASALDQWWWGYWDEIGININNISLMRPEYQGNNEEPDEDTGMVFIDTGEEEEEEEEMEEEEEDTDDNSIDPGSDSTDSESGWFNCASAPQSTMAFWPLGLAALLLGARRREGRR